MLFLVFLVSRRTFLKNILFLLNPVVEVFSYGTSDKGTVMLVTASFQGNK